VHHLLGLQQTSKLKVTTMSFFFPEIFHPFFHSGTSTSFNRLSSFVKSAFVLGMVESASFDPTRLDHPEAQAAVLVEETRELLELLRQLDG